MRHSIAPRNPRRRLRSGVPDRQRRDPAGGAAHPADADRRTDRRTSRAVRQGRQRQPRRQAPDPGLLRAAGLGVDKRRGRPGSRRDFPDPGDKGQGPLDRGDVPQIVRLGQRAAAGRSVPDRPGARLGAGGRSGRWVIDRRRRLGPCARSAGPKSTAPANRPTPARRVTTRCWPPSAVRARSCTRDCAGAGPIPAAAGPTSSPRRSRGQGTPAPKARSR